MPLFDYFQRHHTARGTCACTPSGRAPHAARRASAGVKISLVAHRGAHAHTRAALDQPRRTRLSNLHMAISGFFLKRIAGIIGRSRRGIPMSGKKAATPTGEPVAKRGRGGGGRGAGRKAGGVNARGVDDPALPAKRQSSLADLLGPRFAPKKVESPLVEPLAAVAGPSLAASSPVNEAGPSSAARAVAAEPFQSSQELGEQWHHLCGFGEMELVEQHVETVLLENATFLQRVLASNDELFFGPAKELLLAVSKRLGRSAGVDGIDGMDVDGGSVRRVDGIDGMDVDGGSDDAATPAPRLWKNGGHRVAGVATSPPCGGRRGLPSLMFDYFMKVVYIPLKSGMIPLLIIFMQTLIILPGSILVN